MKSIRAAVLGATGYAGAELVRILSGHPNVLLTYLSSRSYASKPIASVFPAFAGVVDLKCREMDLKAISDSSDVVFIALPHKIPMSVAPELLAAGKKVVDLSADFRFRNLSVYEAHYQPHTAKDAAKDSVYGLCEINRKDIKEATLVGNPGCYPTSALLPLIPFIGEGLLDEASIVIDSKSGVSGAGRSLALSAHFCEVHEGFSAYKVAAHRHEPEIEENLSIKAKRPVTITFVPHLVPMSRGMLTTSYAKLAKGLTTDQANELLSGYYEKSPFARVCATGNLPQTRNVRGTNFCDMAARVDSHAGRLILVSAIDNLVKGASGQAVQNMNLMFDLPETAGLDAVPYPL
ncbi:MAG: N-acetyl-gamma-glutamyl-phosphate reductase [Deltaproteobacteria bacterium]|nr:N-acetyl-gamma-glutamyl-phosphate reductase [Deltaproteobacteria bacterium]